MASFFTTTNTVLRTETFLKDDNTNDLHMRVYVEGSDEPQEYSYEDIYHWVFEFDMENEGGVCTYKRKLVFKTYWVGAPQVMNTFQKHIEDVKNYALHHASGLAKTEGYLKPK